MKQRYVIGLDFGTKSGRALLVDAKTGETAAQSVKDYAHGVMDRFLPDGKTALGAGWALQHPKDYLDTLEYTVREAVSLAGIPAGDIIGLSIDFTACTILPIDAARRPLCFLEKYKNRPHAYVKLWKHHAALPQTSRINEVLAEEGLIDLPLYGGKVSSELFLPKVMQILEEDPEIYHSADAVLEAADWLTLLLTGENRRSFSMASYKAMWDGEKYPSARLLRAFNPGLEHVVEEKMAAEIVPLGSKIGELNEEWAGRLGLLPGTAVGASIIDAHAGLPGCGITKPGQMMLIIGTSSVQAVLSEKPYSGKGVMGGVNGGIIDGYYALESGLAGVGDIFEWFVSNAVPERYGAMAKAEGKSLFRFLGEAAAKGRPGKSGLLALDWWNGNKTPFVDAGLSGVLVGCTMATRPEDIYRALVEATGFGTRMIMDTFAEAGVEIDEIRACGGIAEKDPALMQIYADITNREIKVSASGQTAALGAAMYAATAAGAERGGYSRIAGAAAAMSRTRDRAFTPNPDNVAPYSALYSHYRELSAYFGANGIMKELKALSGGQGSADLLTSRIN
ncbi:MAG: ribulokinase [Treponema sp.]|jgi:L-ribulokinase|nr:ribulokinase [Treponema sp.]